MMKRHIHFLLLPLMALLPWLLASCTDDLGESPKTVVAVDDSNLVETRISLGVTAMSTTSAETRADEDDKQSAMTDEEKRGSDAERKIDNIWVFQFDASSNKLLITPRYYDLSEENVIPDEDNGKDVDVLLKPDVQSTVYVVANTGDSLWATVKNSGTLDEVKKLTLTAPWYHYVNIGDTVDNLSLPMEGGVEGVTPQENSVIDVMVTRMYAKVEITIGDVPETIVFTDVNVSQIPFYCQVGTLATADPMQDAAKYPTDDDDLWNSYGFDPGDKDGDGKYTGKMVIYVPENLQGRNDNGENDEARKTENAKKNALRVDFVANYINQFTGEELERGRNYTIYPGCNNYNDYNVKRNFIYRVKMNLYTDKYDQDIPSSNCFVVKPNQTLSFLPYYRTETGGGHEFTDFLDGKGTDDSKMINNSDNMLENVKIIWQTQDAIGDNTNGDLVWIDRRSEAEDEYHRKIHVKTGSRGNALIAAYNSSGQIVWSWHIWVTENEPANVSSAVVYSTYAWDNTGIKTNVRVPGYAIMPCNLGALKYEPDGGEAANNGGTYSEKVAPDTHGMLYQWGRKDPFPPSTKTTDGNALNYTNAVTGNHYANDNTTVVEKTAGTSKDTLFHSIIMTDIARREIAYSIQNPTVFICGTYKANQGENYVKDYKTAKDNYVNKGDWQEIHQETLWGGTNPVTGGSMKYLKLDMPKDPAGNDIHIFDNYGDEKSIFDPCPSGWRVPPGDLWLGFTQTGMNPEEGTYNIINTSTPEGKSKAGMYMYMNGWQDGTRLFFPTQGCRVADGRIIRSASCGNYHNATTDATTSETGRDGQRVNILHIHNTAGLFRVFETTYYMYYVKSTAGPIRCVRDHK